MLTTAIQHSIKIETKEHLGVKVYTYTCYGDSEDFLFYKYRKEEQQGGYAQFTVKLPVPTESEADKIKAQLYNGISPQLLAKSKLIVQYIKAEKVFNSDPTNKANQDAKIKAFQKNIYSLITLMRVMINFSVN